MNWDRLAGTSVRRGRRRRDRATTTIELDRLATLASRVGVAAMIVIAVAAAWLAALWPAGDSNEVAINAAANRADRDGAPSIIVGHGPRAAARRGPVVEVAIGPSPLAQQHDTSRRRRTSSTARRASSLPAAQVERQDTRAAAVLIRGSLIQGLGSEASRCRRWTSTPDPSESAMLPSILLASPARYRRTASARAQLVRADQRGARQAAPAQARRHAAAGDHADRAKRRADRRRAAGVYDLLPWGEQTTINAKIENQTLRGGLEAITRKLGLTFELRDEAVEIQPLPALRRLGRRATVEELAVLDLLGADDLELQSRPPDRQAAPRRGRPEARSGQERLRRGEPRGRRDRRTAVPVAAQRDAAGGARDASRRATDATWYPWGKTRMRRPAQGRSRARPAHQDDHAPLQRRGRLAGAGRAASLSGVRSASSRGRCSASRRLRRTSAWCLENATDPAGAGEHRRLHRAGVERQRQGVYIWNPSTARASAATRADDRRC